jgi:hypothetical protein
MRDSIAAENLPGVVAILGVNHKEGESGIPDMSAGRDLPLLQDTAQANVWGLWSVTYRDVVVLDAENRVVTVYNLTEHDLGQPANYDSLRAILRRAAGGR